MLTIFLFSSSTTGPKLVWQCPFLFFLFALITLESETGRLVLSLSLSLSPSRLFGVLISAEHKFVRKRAYNKTPVLIGNDRVANGIGISSGNQSSLVCLFSFTTRTIAG